MRETPVEVMASIFSRGITSEAPSAALSTCAVADSSAMIPEYDPAARGRHVVVHVVGRDLAVRVEDVDEQILRRAARDRRQAGTDIHAPALGLVAGGADLDEDLRPGWPIRRSG